MKKIIRLIPILTIALLTVSCSKKAKQVVENPGSAIESTEIVERLNANRVNQQQVTCRMSLDLEAGKQSLSVGGNLKMKRNDVIQMSLQVFGFVEAGRIEFTQDYMLILNRIGKQYVKVDYKDVDFFKRNNIDFFTFQALFWNELFAPGQSDSRPTASQFAQDKDGKNITLTHTTKQLVLKFITNATTGMLEQTLIDGENGGAMRWNYNSWARLNSKDFPDKMKISATIKNTTVSANLQLSRLRTDEKWKDTRTNIDTKKIRQVTIDAAFRQILSLSN